MLSIESECSVMGWWRGQGLARVKLMQSWWSLWSPHPPLGFFSFSFFLKPVTVYWRLKTFQLSIYIIASKLLLSPWGKEIVFGRFDDRFNLLEAGVRITVCLLVVHAAVADVEDPGALGHDHLQLQYSTV